MTRALPWTEIVSAIGEERFVQIRESLAQGGVNDLDRDAFLLAAAPGQLLKEMMPDDAPAEAINAYGALIHMLYAAWARDWPVVAVTADQLRSSLLRPTPYAPRPVFVVCYIQLPERLVWAEPVDEEPHEPLDGVFLIATADQAHALAILGFRQARDGFTTMEGAISLPAPPPPGRSNGTAAFSTVLPGGDKAQLLSVLDAHELVALALAALEAAERGA